MAAREPAVGREIFCVELTRERAESAAEALLAQGRHPRIHQRTVRAEGIDVAGYIVVVDRKAVRA